MLDRVRVLGVTIHFPGKLIHTTRTTRFWSYHDALAGSMKICYGCGASRDVGAYGNQVHYYEYLHARKANESVIDISAEYDHQIT